MSYYELIIQVGDGVSYVPNPTPPTDVPAPLTVAATINGPHAGSIITNDRTVQMRVVPASAPGQLPRIVLQFSR